MQELPHGVSFTRLRDVRRSGRPGAMPELGEGEYLMCDYIRVPELPEFNKTLIVNTLQDAQDIHDGYWNGGAVELHWYIASDISITMLDRRMTGE